MANDNWDRQIFNLPENHGWEAKPGNKLFIADRGALRFEIPQDWLVEPNRKSVKFRDAKPPDDTMGLEVSVIYAGVRGARVDWSALPLSEVIRSVTSADAPTRPGRASRKRRNRDQDETKVGPPMAIKLGNLEMAWVESEFIDPGEKRPAFTRTAVTRDPEASIHALLTFSFWPEDAERAKAIWNDVLGTLKMGEYYESPLRGPGSGGAQRRRPWDVPGK